MQEEKKKRPRGGYLQAAAAILIGALIVGIYASTLGTHRKDASQERVSATASDASVQSGDEARLAAILSQMKGAGKVAVMITYESGPEIVPAQITQLDTSEQTDTGGQSSSSSITRRQTSQPATNGASQDSAVVLKELSAVVKGVVVIAQGADDIAVKLDLLRATVTALQIDESRVDVFAMRND